MTQEEITDREFKISLLYKLEGLSSIRMNETDSYNKDLLIALSKLVNSFYCGQIDKNKIDFEKIVDIVRDDELSLDKVRKMLNAIKKDSR